MVPFKRLCMYHEVYRSWWLFSSQSPSRFSKWRIIMRHSLNHISCDSSWFSPDTGHRSSESWFSGSHLCMLTLLLIWTWKLPHQTFSQFCEQAERKHRHVDILGNEKVLTSRSCWRKSHSQLLVSEMFSSGTNSTYSNCDFLMYIHENDQD